MYVMFCRCVGEVYQWKFYARKAGVFYAAVWRQIKPQELRLRGRNRIEVDSEGAKVDLCLALNVRI